MTPPHILLFGDNTFEKLDTIKYLVRRAKASPTLARFLRDATDVAQIEMAKLSSIAARELTNFDSLLELAEEHGEQQEANEIVNITLACIARLGELIILVENDPSILCPTSTVKILGLCTGLLPAAVAAVARSTDEILEFGQQVIAVSIRLAKEIVSRSEYLEGGIGSWGYTIVGADAASLQAILDAFHHNQGIPTHKQVYLGVISRGWITIMGPPSVLSGLFSYSPAVERAPKQQTSIGTAVHAGHLPPLDIEKMLGISASLNAPVRGDARTVSSATGLPYVASNLRALLSQSIHDITQNRLRLTDIIGNAVSDLCGFEDVSLVVVGPTPQASMIRQALEDSQISVSINGRIEVSTKVPRLRAGSESVAIVGMSGRFPGSDNIEDFWKNLQDGFDAHTKVPRSRFDVDAHFDARDAKYGCFMKSPGLFDNRLFNVSPREAVQMDPMQRLLLMTSYEALERAGYSPNGSLSTNSSRIATYVGQATDDWRAVNECLGVDIYSVPSVERAFCPGRLNYHHKWGGGSYSIDSACASSSTAVALACSDLLARKCDTALAGGGNLLVAPSLYAGLSRGGFLSPTGACKTFSDAADGYCRGEGVGVVVLKRLEDAVADNDNIQAVISTFAKNYSADATSITQPHAATQAKLYSQVLRQACLSPNDINYVEMHGTGTQAGDVCEMQSVTNIFGQGRTEENPLIVGAVKANVGHGEAAAGVTSLIKMVMMLRNNSVPPQPGAPFRMNRKFPPLQKMNVEIPFTSISLQPAPGSDGKRKMLLSNFDASGGNTCLIVEDPPQRLPKAQDPRTYHAVTCSARTASSLANNKRRLLQFLIENPETNLSDIAYTMTARRQHESLRSSYTAKDTKDLTRLISADLTGTSTAPRSKAGRASAVVFVFTGQGSVYTGMCSQLFHTCRRFQEMILSYQMICDSLGFPGVVEMIQRSKLDVEPRTTTVKSQLALVIVEIALARLWISWGLRPSLLIGHSLGEFAALCVSGVLSVSDTLYLVGKRSTMMQETCSPHTHTMLAVGGTMEDVAQLLAIRHRDCQVSCINAPANVVVSGPNEELKGLQIEAQARGMSAVFLNVQYGFHSSQMDSILPGFEACARGVHFSKPKIPIASTLTGTIVEDGGTFCPTYLRQQAREPVRFTDALKACVATGADDPRIWMEIGPEPICLGLIRANLHVASMTLLPTIKSTEDNWKTITTSISTAYEFMVSLGWLEYHREYIDALTLLELPTYAFDLKKYWSSYSPKPLPRRDNIPTETCTPAVRPNLSTCLQQVVKESFEDEQISVTFISHTSDPMLLKAIQGHLVAGTALCPASAFCDMAYTAAKYIHNKENPGKAIPDMSIRALNLTHPVTLHSSNSEIVVEISATMYRADNSSVHISFASRQGSSTMSNGSCEIKFESSYHWQPQFLRTLHLVHSRMRTLVDSSMAGRGHRLLRPIVYKLFADLVEYDDKYQSIQQVFVDENYVDAAADIVPTSKSDTGVFTYNPYWIDALMHLAGFILNAHVTKSKDIVYLATGFDSLRVIDALSEEKRYRSYVSVQDGDKSIVVADVHVFEGDKLVAYCAGLEFRSMTRTVLKTLLGTGAPDGYIPHSQLGTTITESGHAGSDIRGARRETMGEASRATHKPRHASVSNAPVSRLSKPVPSSTSLGPYEEFSDKADALLALVASEAGLKSEDLEPSTRFSNLGVDSLMSIAIVSAANHRLSLELSASFFIDCPTVSDVQVQLGKRRNREHGSAQQTSTSEQELSPLQTPSEASMHSPRTETDVGYSESEPGSLESNAKSTELGHVTNDSIKPTGRIKREANVVLMQGRPSSTETPLFLIADGAGSATSYIHIPRLPRHNRIYAIESPFLHSPQDYTISVQEISHIFLSAVLKTQPEGPYIIGGWSAGAVYAYEVSRLLLTQGETVLGLILIDMHVPKPMPQDIEASVEFIEEAGIDTGLKRSCHPSSAPSYDLKQHLVSTVRALMHFKPTPMEPACRPNHTFLIWARRGLNETAGDGLPRFKKEKTPASSSLAREGKSGAADATGLGFEAWFYGERSDFGPKGWEDLVGDVECHVMEADHFSMVVPPHVGVLGDFLKQAVEKCVTHLE